MSLTKPFALLLFVASLTLSNAAIGQDQSSNQPTDASRAKIDKLEHKLAELTKQTAQEQTKLKQTIAKLTKQLAIVRADVAANKKIGTHESERPFVVELLTEAEKRYQVGLEKTVTDFVFKNATLADLVKNIEQHHGFQVELDNRALEDEGLSASDIEITCDLADISLRNALRIVMDPHEMTWVFKNDVMYLTTDIACEEEMVTRLYLISEFMDPHQPEATEVLMKLIQTETDGLWSETDGDGGTMTRFGTKLVVRQTQRAHDEILSLLRLLRHAEELDSKSRANSGDRKAKEVVKPRRRTAATPTSPRDNRAVYYVSRSVNVPTANRKQVGMGAGNGLGLLPAGVYIYILQQRIWNVSAEIQHMAMMQSKSANQWLRDELLIRPHWRGTQMSIEFGVTGTDESQLVRIIDVVEREFRQALATINATQLVNDTRNELASAKKELLEKQTELTRLEKQNATGRQMKPIVDQLTMLRDREKGTQQTLFEMGLSLDPNQGSSLFGRGGLGGAGLGGGGGGGLGGAGLGGGGGGFF